MILKGRNLIIKADGKSIACARSCEIEIDTDAIEVSSPQTGKWKKFIPGRSSWSVAVGSLVRVETSADNLRSIMRMSGKTVTLNVTVGDGLVYEWEGEAICTTASITGTLGNLAQGAFKFQGSGELQDKKTTLECHAITANIIPLPKDGAPGYFLIHDRISLPPIRIKYFFVNGNSIDITPDTGIEYVTATTTYIYNGTRFVVKP